jgi:branched-chain amino acid transport system permease protein
MQEVLTAISLASIYLLFSLGMSLTWGTIDILNFAHGSIFMFSTFCVYLLLESVRLPLLLVVLLGAAIGAAMSLLVQILAFEQIIRRAWDRRGAEMQILIGGIGVATIPLAIAEEQTKSNPFGLTNSSFHVVTYQGAGLHTTNVALVTILLAAVLWAGITLWLRRSKHGLALRAIGVDAETASLMGIDRRRLALVSMATAGALAGLAGVMFTYSLSSIQPDSGDTLLVKAFAIVILGGVGSMLGVAVGALVLAGAEVVVLNQTSGAWVDAISFGLIFVVLLLRPSGLFGRKEVVRA